MLIKQYSKIKMNWSKYYNGHQKVKFRAQMPRCIVNALGSCVTQYFRTDKIGARTKLIKLALRTLGDRMGFKVYTNRLRPDLRRPNGGKYKDHEWLYDLHWYTESGPYQLKTLPLVVECEWRSRRIKDKANDPFSGVKFDFQKLLVANADLRLMIFEINLADLQALDAYFETVIQSYEHLEEGAEFLFIAFDAKMQGFHYELKKRIGR